MWANRSKQGKITDILTRCSRAPLDNTDHGALRTSYLASSPIYTCRIRAFKCIKESSIISHMTDFQITDAWLVNLRQQETPNIRERWNRHVHRQWFEKLVRIAFVTIWRIFLGQPTTSIEWKVLGIYSKELHQVSYIITIQPQKALTLTLAKKELMNWATYHWQ